MIYGIEHQDNHEWCYEVRPGYLNRFITFKTTDINEAYHYQRYLTEVHHGVVVNKYLVREFV